MIQPTANYNDFTGLAELRAEAAKNTPETAPEVAKNVARQFEAIFVQMMLKSMRDASEVLGEKKDTSYQDMFDQQISLELTKEKGLGLADMMLRQLSVADPDKNTDGLK